ncbi:MAG: HNH endonuclease [Candidatus Binatia bacterium]
MTISLDSLADTPADSLAHLSERELLDHFEGLVVRDRRTTADLLVAIAEIDERKLWAKFACSSMFTFCMKRFHMSEQAAAKRLRAARTARRYPVLRAMVARGELHLSAIQRLAGHLTQDNHVELLERARHKSSREVEYLVAELAPRPDVPSRIRALPGRGVACASADGPAVASKDGKPVKPAQTGSVPADATATGATAGAAAATAATAQGERTAGGASADGGEIAGVGSAAGPSPDGNEGSSARERRPPWPPRPGSAPRPIVALGPRRYKIEITVDQAVHDKLRSLQDLLGRSETGRDPAAIIGRAIDLLLVQTLQRKAAHTDRPRPPAAVAATSGGRRTRGVPAAVRREVWRRDCGRCRYVDARGRRCDETRNIEFHHEVPFARGGGHTPDNVELRCRAHNQYQADLDFGRSFMDGKRGTPGGAGTFPGDCCAAAG